MRPDRTAKGDLSTLLIIDEAHLIDPQALTDLRLLVSSALDTELPLKILLSGQEPLARLLAQTSLSDLVNRITVRCHLAAQTKDRTASSIDSRTRRAGSHDKVFEPEAKALIHDYASGIPRLINNITTACLLNAAVRNLNKINEPLVTETMAEFRLPLVEIIMSNRYSNQKLRMLRNQVPISRIISDFLDLPSKVSEGHFRFLCPLCSEFQTATNSKTNLA